MICTIFSQLFFRHVHSQCDPDANEQTVLEKRAVQYNYMFTCKVCKGQTQRAATMETGLGPKAGSTPAIMSPRDGMSGDDSMTPEHLKASTSWTGASLDNSLENEEKDDVKMGMGRGKPMSALTGKLHTKYRKYCVISIFSFLRWWILKNNIFWENINIGAGRQ